MYRSIGHAFPIVYIMPYDTYCNTMRLSWRRQWLWTSGFL